MRARDDLAQQRTGSDIDPQNICRSVGTDQEGGAVEGGSGSDIHPRHTGELGKVSLADILRPDELVGCFVEGVQHSVPGRKDHVVSVYTGSGGHTGIGNEVAGRLPIQQ